MGYDIIQTARWHMIILACLRTKTVCSKGRINVLNHPDYKALSDIDQNMNIHMVKLKSKIYAEVRPPEMFL
jgi:hypothetical protein